MRYKYLNLNKQFYSNFKDRFSREGKELEKKFVIIYILSPEPIRENILI